MAIVNRSLAGPTECAVDRDGGHEPARVRARPRSVGHPVSLPDAAKRRPRARSRPTVAVPRSQRSPISAHPARSAALATRTPSGALISISDIGAASGMGSGSTSAHPQNHAAISNAGTTGSHTARHASLSSRRALPAVALQAGHQPQARSIVPPIKTIRIVRQFSRSTFRPPSRGYRSRELIE